MSRIEVHMGLFLTSVSVCIGARFLRVCVSHDVLQGALYEHTTASATFSNVDVPDRASAFVVLETKVGSYSLISVNSKRCHEDERSYT